MIARLLTEGKGNHDMEIFRIAQEENGLTQEVLAEAVLSSLQERSLNRVLILPPDFTRYHSNAGLLTNMYYHALTEMGVQVDILPAVGTHVAVTDQEINATFGDIPHDRFFVHNWRTDVASSERCRVIISRRLRKEFGVNPLMWKSIRWFWIPLMI